MYKYYQTAQTNISKILSVWPIDPFQDSVKYVKKNDLTGV